MPVEDVPYEGNPEAEAALKKDIENFWGPVVKTFKKLHNDPTIFKALHGGRITESELARYAFQSVNRALHMLNEDAQTGGQKIINPEYEYSTDEFTMMTRTELAKTIQTMYAAACRPVGERHYLKPLLLWGPPGIGKTAIVKQVAEELSIMPNPARGRAGRKLTVKIIDGTALRNDTILFITSDRVQRTEMVPTKRFTEELSAWLEKRDEEDAQKYIDGVSGIDYYKAALDFYKDQGIDFSKRMDHDFDTLVHNDADAMKTLTDAKRFGVYRVTGDPEKDIIANNIANGGVGIPGQPGYKEGHGGFIFIDEFSRVNPLTLNVLMGYVNERAIGEYVIGDRWIVLGAANRLEDLGKKNKEYAEDYIRELAFRNRFDQHNYYTTCEEWLQWAKKAGIDEDIIDFISLYREEVYYQKKVADDKATGYASPRSWEALSNKIKELRVTLNDIVNQVEDSLEYQKTSGISDEEAIQDAMIGQPSDNEKMIRAIFNALKSNTNSKESAYKNVEQEFLGLRKSTGLIGTTGRRFESYLETVKYITPVAKTIITSTPVESSKSFLDNYNDFISKTQTVDTPYVKLSFISQLLKYLDNKYNTRSELINDTKTLNNLLWALYNFKQDIITQPNLKIVPALLMKNATSVERTQATAAIDSLNTGEYDFRTFAQTMLRGQEIK